MQPLLRSLKLEDSTPAERRATVWIAVMFFCSLASTFLLRPLRDQFGVDRGVEQLPYLYSLTLLATVVCVLPFWWLCNRMPSRRFVPLVQHVCAAAFVLLAVGLSVVDYRWQEQPWIGELFWGGYSAINVVLPTLVWIHAVEHFRRDQGKRLFALIAVGGTGGAVFGSWLAGLLASDDIAAPLWVTGAMAAFVLECGFLAFVGSQASCRAMRLEGVTDCDSNQPPVAAAGVFAGLRLIAKDGYVRGIGVYMMLLGAVATAFYAAQTELVDEQIQAARQQHTILADIQFWAQSLVLVLQLFATGRLLRRFSPTVMLVSLPLISIIGLGVWGIWPLVPAIFVIQVARRGAQYAFEKPARELLYTPLSLETKHKAKFLFDTFAFRLGDLLGAILQVSLRDRDLGLGTAGIVSATIALALVWVGLGVFLGRWRQRPAPAPSS
ncbi:MAG: hypothetical protein NXI31_06990 [bacterium]|nr:hypothetical protein [bacterium]